MPIYLYLSSFLLSYLYYTHVEIKKKKTLYKIHFSADVKFAMDPVFSKYQKQAHCVQ